MSSQKYQIAQELITQRVLLSEFTRQLAATGVQVVQPDQMVTGVFYSDERRFFPRVDSHGFVISGYFG